MPGQSHSDTGLHHIQSSRWTPSHWCETQQDTRCNFDNRDDWRKKWICKKKFPQRLDFNNQNIMVIFCDNWWLQIGCRADSWLATSQWEMLLCHLSLAGCKPRISPGMYPSALHEIINILGRRQNGHHFADTIFAIIFLYEDCYFFYPNFSEICSQWFH